MAKKPTEQPAQAGASTAEKLSATAPAATNGAVKIDLDKPLIQEAIKQGNVLIADGKSKADAARAMYAVIKDEPKEIIVAAFIEGAALTEKGALTYWYNCKRRAAKQA
jgi:predicted phage-related endonuclease